MPFYFSGLTENLTQVVYSKYLYLFRINALVNFKDVELGMVINTRDASTLGD